MIKNNLKINKEKKNMKKIIKNNKKNIYLNNKSKTSGQQIIYLIENG